MRSERRASSVASSGPLRPPNPAVLVIVIAVVVFLLELVEPVALGLLPPMLHGAQDIVDALLMISVLSVLLFFFLVQPLTAQINQRERVEEELREVNEDLETLVQERTTELLEANRKLVGAIEEQRSTAESLRRNSAFVESVFNKTGCLLLALDSATRRCVYVNSRVTDLLGYEQDELAAVSNDLLTMVATPADRDRLLADITTVTNDPSKEGSWRSFDFLTARKRRVTLLVGLSALDLTPSKRARTLLLTAIPAQV